MIFGVPEVAGHHGPEFARNLAIDACRLFETAAFHQAHGGIDDGFRREPVSHSQFKPENIARQMKTRRSAAVLRKAACMSEERRG